MTKPNKPDPECLDGRRILVADDEYFAAADIMTTLNEAHATVVGPAPSVEKARDLLLADANIEGAVLDVNLQGQRVWPVVDMLLQRGLPVVLATGYDEGSIPPAYRSLPRLLKPVRARDLIQVLEDLLPAA